MSYNSNNVRSGNTVVPWTPPKASYWQSDSIYSGVIGVAMLNMLFQQQMCQSLTNQMTERMEVARDATEMAGLVDAAMADMAADPEAKGTLPESVIKYMDENKIYVDGKPIKEFAGSGSLSKGEMMQVKAALDSTAAAASDFNQQIQLKLQDVLGKCNACAKMIESVTSMQAEAARSVAAAIR